VLYGAESPHQWLPRSPSGSPVLALGGPPRLTRVDQITVEEVFEQWRTLSQQPRTGAAAPTPSHDATVQPGTGT
jgi:heptosyltransferase-2/heptosyltransferase-3